MKFGLFYFLFTSLLVVCGLLVLLSPPSGLVALLSTLKQNTEATNDFKAMEVAPRQISQVKAITGSFPAHQLKGDSFRKYTPRKRNEVELKYIIPPKLGVANYDVRWTIKSLNQKLVFHNRGQRASIMLSAGKYLVTMRVARFQKKETIHVRKSDDSIQKFSFPFKEGLLKVDLENVKSSLPDSIIKVIDNRGRVVTRSRGRPIKRILKPGKYIIYYHLGKKTKVG